jgi:hypothetical protein
VSVHRPDPIRIAAINAAIRIQDIRPQGANVISQVSETVEEEIRRLLDYMAGEHPADENYADA